MSSRPLLSPYPVILNGDMSLPSITSMVTIIQNLSMLSYEITWSGASPVGTIDVQVSNDYAQNVDGTTRTAGHWSSLPLSGPTAISGNTGTGFIDIDEMAGYAMRVVYTGASGTGVLNVIINGKVA